MIKGVYKHTEERKKKISDAQRGEKNHMFGKHLSEATKRKLSIALKGRIVSEDTRRKMGAWQVGRKLSDETRKRIRESKKNISLETRKKISEAAKGRKISEEARRKIGNAHRGKKRPPFPKAWKIKMSLSRLKRKHLLGYLNSPEIREKISKSQRGANHYNWKGGLTSLKLTIRRCAKYRDWRSRIFKRDNYSCLKCGIGGNGENINADHIKPFSIILYENNIKTLEQALSCNELWDIDNGRTLCVPCHKKTDTYGFQSIYFKNPKKESCVYVR